MSKKGYVPNRLPSANQVAASLNKTFRGCYFYVEGSTDSCMWRNFLDDKNVKIVACNGWKNVVETVSKTLADGNKCLGVVDLDFQDFIPDGEKIHPNVFMTDDHDIEMMIYHSGDYLKAINGLDPNGKRQQYEGDNNIRLLDEVKAIVDNIARLRIIVKKNKLDLVFRNMNKKQEFSYPNYEGILDKHTYTYVSDDKLIQFLTVWSNGITKAHVTPAEITPLFSEEKAREYDMWKFLNGHDMTLILYILLKKKVKLSGLTNAETLERNLYVAYERASLQQTELYAKIQEYAEHNNIVIFK